MARAVHCVGQAGGCPLHAARTMMCSTHTFLSLLTHAIQCQVISIMTAAHQSGRALKGSGAC